MSIVNHKQSTVPYCEFTSQIHRPWPTHSVSYGSLCRTSTFTLLIQLLYTIISVFFFLCPKFAVRAASQCWLKSQELRSYSENHLLGDGGSPATDVLILPGAGCVCVDVSLRPRGRCHRVNLPLHLLSPLGCLSADCNRNLSSGCLDLFSICSLGHLYRWPAFPCARHLYLSLYRLSANHCNYFIHPSPPSFLLSYLFLTVALLPPSSTHFCLILALSVRLRASFSTTSVVMLIQTMVGKKMERKEKGKKKSTVE